MIASCKIYITNNHSETIWTMEPPVVKQRLETCIQLYEGYKSNYIIVKKNLEAHPQERQFDFSEVYIFGKFDIFVGRLKLIIEMFQTMDIYSHLSESKIEGNWRHFFVHHVMQSQTYKLKIVIDFTIWQYFVPPR